MTNGTQDAIEAIDQEARGLARAAAALIASHERVCEERWDQLRTSIQERRTEAKEDAVAIKMQIAGIYTHMWIAAGFIITFLIGISGFLFVKAYP